MKPDILIIGAGFAGSTIARLAAEDGKRVLVLEKRNHIGGNAYDTLDENHVRRHEYGPHIFHTNNQKVVTFLSRFTTWYPYEHRVLGWVEDKLVPIPFNLTSIQSCFPKEQADHLIEVLLASYGEGKKVPILTLRENTDPTIKELADYIYEHVFKYYTMKQWGLTPEEIDPAVTGRVPVSVSYDDRYFADSFQQMPTDGYTALFEKLLDHPNIEVALHTEAKDRLQLDEKNAKLFFDGEEFQGKVVYTGAVDDLFDQRLGELPYRSLDFEIKTEEGTHQPVATVNYPTPESLHPYTRITEYKLMMEKIPSEKTTLAYEFPLPYDAKAKKGNIPYYPIFTEENQAKYEQYLDLLKPFPQIVLLGRLAEHRYYNMDAIVERALELYPEL